MKTSSVVRAGLLAMSLAVLAPVAVAQTDDRAPARAMAADDDDGERGLWGLLGLLGLAGLMRRKDHRNDNLHDTRRTP